MITITASEVLCEVTAGTTTSRRRVAMDGECPYDRPIRIRAGKERGENVVITLRWDDVAAAVRVDIAKRSGHGTLPKIEVRDNIADLPDGNGTITIHVDILDREADIRITRVRLVPPGHRG
jgi:hypothetical protein